MLLMTRQNGPFDNVERQCLKNPVKPPLRRRIGGQGTERTVSDGKWGRGESLEDS